MICTVCLHSWQVVDSEERHPFTVGTVPGFRHSSFFHCWISHLFLKLLLVKCNAQTKAADPISRCALLEILKMTASLWHTKKQPFLHWDILILKTLACKRLHNSSEQKAIFQMCPSALGCLPKEECKPSRCAVFLLGFIYQQVERSSSKYRVKTVLRHTCLINIFLSAFLGRRAMGGDVHSVGLLKYSNYPNEPGKPSEVA